MKTEEKRDASIDALRGLAILLVVFGHSLQYSNTDFDNNILFRIIYSFHMPLFMFISGYVTFFGQDKIVPGFKKRAILLLFPFFSWAVVTFFVNAVMEDRLSWHQAEIFFNNLIKSPDNNGLWFLWVIFLISGIVVLLKICKIKLEIGLAVLWVLLNFDLIKWPEANFLGIGLLNYHLLYFLMGFLFCKTRNQYKKVYTIFLYFCAVIFPFSIAYWHRTTPPFFISELNLSAGTTTDIWLAYKYFCGITGTGFAIIVISCLNKLAPTISEKLKKIGLITLEIYAIHYYFLMIMLAVFTVQEYSLRVLLVFSFTFLSSMLIISIMKKSPLTSLVFFGQTKKK
ncbi:acyltransferase family protein [Pedobacter hiemivivus]|nr:acyltransferase [Pedobacter hiemivivus]